MCPSQPSWLVYIFFKDGLIWARCALWKIWLGATDFQVSKYEEKLKKLGRTLAVTGQKQAPLGGARSDSVEGTEGEGGGGGGGEGGVSGLALTVHTFQQHQDYQALQ